MQAIHLSKFSFLFWVNQPRCCAARCCFLVESRARPTKKAPNQSVRGFGASRRKTKGDVKRAYLAGAAMGIMPPRVIDIALHNSLRSGVEASQAIPAGMRMGESLPLVPPKAQPASPSEPGDVPQEYQQHRRPPADLAERREQADAGGGDTHHPDGHHQHPLAPETVAEVAKDNPAQRAKKKPDAPKKMPINQKK